MDVHVPLVQASAEAVPLADASFDIVFCDHGAMNFADPYRTVPEVAGCCGSEDLSLWSEL